MLPLGSHILTETASCDKNILRTSLPDTLLPHRQRHLEGAHTFGMSRILVHLDYGARLYTSTARYAWYYNAIPYADLTNPFSQLTQVPEDIATARRPSIPAQESIPHIYIQNSVDQSSGYPPSAADASVAQPKYHYRPESQHPHHHYSHAGTYVPHPHPQPGFSSPSDGSYAPGPSPTEAPYQQQTNELQYPPEGNYSMGSNPAPGTMGGMHAGVPGYAPPTNEYTYAPGHAQEPYGSFN